MDVTVYEQPPAPPPAKRVVIDLSEEEAVELATIFFYKVSGIWHLRANVTPEERENRGSLIERLSEVGIKPNHSLLPNGQKYVHQDGTVDA